MAEGHQLPRGVRGHDPPPRSFLNEHTLRCNLVHFDHNFEIMLQSILFYLSYSVLRQGIRTSCALTSWRLDNFYNIVTNVL